VAGYVILNGEVIDAEDAAVAADDRAFLYGDSVFTTLRCYGGVPFRLDRHCARLNASLRSPMVDIDYAVDAEQLAADIAKLVELNGCPEAAVRFTVSRGRGAGPIPPHTARPTTLLVVRPYQPNAALYAEGVKLAVSSVRRDPAGELGKHKLGSYAPCLAARRQAQAAGADEGVITDTAGNLLECACSNLFAVVAGVLVTPDVSRNLLPGIARETVLECAARLGMTVSLEDLTPDLVRRADEMFITNSLIELAPVAALDGRPFPAPGPVAERLLRAYREETAK